MTTSGQTNEPQMSEITKCIFRNVTSLLIVALILVICISHIPALRETLLLPSSMTAAMLIFISSIVLMILVQTQNMSSTMTRVTLGMFIISSMIFLCISAAYTSPHLAALSLILSIMIFGVMSVIGLKQPLIKTELQSWTTPLLLSLISILAISIINVAFVNVKWINLGVAIATVLVFSMFILYDVSFFTRHCSGTDCCIEGTVSLWLDFANIFQAMNRNLSI